MYGKLVDGVIIYPNMTNRILVDGNIQIINPRDKDFVDLGYKEIIVDNSALLTDEQNIDFDNPEETTSREIIIRYEELQDSIKEIYEYSDIIE